MIKMNDVCLVAVQEPKLLVSKMTAFARSIGLAYFYFNSLAERNIWLLWNDRVKIKVLFAHEQVLTVEFSFKESEVF